jgi:hypothetical protein
MMSLHPRYGANVHIGWLDSVYADYSKVSVALLKMRARMFRTLLPTGAGQERQFEFIRTMHFAGVGAHLTVGVYNKPVDREELGAALTEIGPYIKHVAGFNEPDSGSGQIDNWIDKTARHQEWLYKFIQADPNLAHIKVASPPLRDSNNRLRVELPELLRRIDEFYDLSNLHCYPQLALADPEFYLDSRLELVPGNRPAIVSEGGWNTGIGVKPGGQPVTEDRQAELSVRYAKYAAECDVRLLFYALLDEPDPKMNQWPHHWGLFHDDYTAKPAVKALAEL